MGILSFCLGAFLSLPKQFATVYIGVILYEASGVETTHQKIVEAIVLIITGAVTIFACWWILDKMNKAKPAVIAERRKAKVMAAYNAKMYSLRSDDLESRSDFASTSTNPFAGGPASIGSSSTVVPKQYHDVDFHQPFNPAGSSVELPLSVKPQRWDADGRAILGNEFHDRPSPDIRYGQQPSGLPAGAGAAAIPGRPSPPDIRVIRASGASYASSPSSPFADPRSPNTPSYDIPLNTPTQTSYARPAPRPQAQTQPERAGPRPASVATDESDSTDSGPQWAAGGSKDTEEVMTPLTISLRTKQSQALGSASARDDLDLYNPYDSPPRQQSSGHRWEATDVTTGSYHTADGSSGFDSPDERQQPPTYGERR